MDAADPFFSLLLRHEAHPFLGYAESRGRHAEWSARTTRAAPAMDLLFDIEDHGEKDRQSGTSSVRSWCRDENPVLDPPPLPFPPTWCRYPGYLPLTADFHP